MPAALAAPLHRAALWIAVAIGLSLPFSTALDGVLLVLLVLVWAGGGGFRVKADTVRRNPFAVAAASLFLLALAGSAHSVGDTGEILHALQKAAVILLIPVLVSLMPGFEFRERAMRAFLVSMATLLLLSFMVWLGILPTGGLIKGTTGDAVVIRKHITHGTLMAFFAFALTVRAREAAHPEWKAVLAALAALAAFNVLFMVQGRTGQLTLVALLGYYLLSVFRWRGVAFAAIAGALIVTAAYLMPSSALHQRVLATIAEVQDWRQSKPAQEANLRPETWGNSLQIIRQHPVFGVGTGGFAAAYAKQVEGTSMRASPQPENQYLLTTVQLGVVGLAALLALFAAQWQLASRLGTGGDTALARGLVITIAVGCLFNSFLLDHTESLFYAWMSGLLFAGLRPRQEGRTR
jgi:O-antigen ligase